MRQWQPLQAQIRRRDTRHLVKVHTISINFKNKDNTRVSGQGPSILFP